MCHSNKNLKAEDRKIGSRLEREATTLTSNVVAPCRSMAKNSRNLSKAPGGSEFLQQIQTLCKQYDLLAKHMGRVHERPTTFANSQTKLCAAYHGPSAASLAEGMQDSVLFEALAVALEALCCHHSATGDLAIKWSELANWYRPGPRQGRILFEVPIGLRPEESKGDLSSK